MTGAFSFLLKQNVTWLKLSFACSCTLFPLKNSNPQEIITFKLLIYLTYCAYLYSTFCQLAFKGENTVLFCFFFSAATNKTLGDKYGKSKVRKQAEKMN